MEIKEILGELGKILSFSNTKTPPTPLPLRLKGSSRSGLSTTKITQNVLKRWQEIGIPVGTLPDGSLNINDQSVQILIEEIINDIKNNARLEIAIEPFGTVTASGVAGPGLPVQVVGIVTTIQAGSGIIQ